MGGPPPPHAIGYLLLFLGLAHLSSCGFVAISWGGPRSGAGRPKRAHDEGPVAASPLAAAAQAATAKKMRSAEPVAVMRTAAGVIACGSHLPVCSEHEIDYRGGNSRLDGARRKLVGVVFC